MARRLTAAVVISALAGPALAPARAQRVIASPTVGDANTTFVFSGFSWRPHAEVLVEYSSICGGTLPCRHPTFRSLRADGRGRFLFREPAGRVPDDFASQLVCFGYGPRAPGSDVRCRAVARVVVVPPWASVTPARLRRDSVLPLPPIFTLAVAHFRAGERLNIEMAYPDGRVRHFVTTARKQGAVVPPDSFARRGYAYAPRGGLVRTLLLAEHDPDGLYNVRVTNRTGVQARTSFELIPLFSRLP